MALAAAVVLPATANDAERFELSLRVEAQIESMSLDARVEAEARLEMKLDRERGVLTLVRPLSPAWKLYRVDPLGPAGECKLAAVTHLARPTWERLDAVRSEVAQLGQERFARWREAGLAAEELDGSFAFVVVGPAEGRFELPLHPGGGAGAPVNRLTDQWLGRPFEQLVEAWAGEDARGPTGYWFWNEGESEPFEWEPHVYHALEAALGLLASPLEPGGGAARSSWRVEWPQAAQTVRGVLGVLAPKAQRRMVAKGGGEARCHRQEAPAGSTTVACTLGPELVVEGAGRPRLTLERQAVFPAASALATSSRARARIDASGGWLTVEVGYRPPSSAH